MEVNEKYLISYCKTEKIVTKYFWMVFRGFRISIPFLCETLIVMEAPQLPHVVSSIVCVCDIGCSICLLCFGPRTVLKNKRNADKESCQQVQNANRNKSTLVRTYARSPPVRSATFWHWNVELSFVAGTHIARPKQNSLTRRVNQSQLIHSIVIRWSWWNVMIHDEIRSFTEAPNALDTFKTKNMAFDRTTKSDILLLVFFSLFSFIPLCLLLFLKINSSSTLVFFIIDWSNKSDCVSVNKMTLQSKYSMLRMI